MNKVPPVISAIGSSHSLVSQITFEDNRCSPVRSRGIENTKWSALSPLRQTPCSSKPMQKPVRKKSTGKLSERSIFRASTTNAVFDSDINVQKSSDLGYWEWHNTDSCASLKDRSSGPMTGGRLIGSRWSWSDSSSRPSLESSTMEFSPEGNPRNRPRSPSMPLMMPQRKSSMMHDKMDLSQHERCQGSGSSLVHNKSVDHFPRHL
jgi:hypothetical protein